MDGITQELHDGRMVLDWLSFTLPHESGRESVQELFGEISARPVGMRGYSHSGSILGTGVVGWSPERPEQGVHVQLPASALSRLAEIDAAVANDPRGFLRYLLDLGAKIRRFDPAFDDREGMLSLDKVRACVESGAVVTRWRKVDRVHCLVGGKGETLYFGSRASESFLRIYNKQAETMERGGEDPGHWVRVELELKGNKAHEVVRRYITERLGFVVGLLRGLIEFKDAEADCNKSRWPVVGWWEAFLGGFEKVKLSLPHEKPTIDSAKHWVFHQVGPSLSFIVQYEGGCMDWVYETIAEGGRRLSPLQRALLQTQSAGVAA
jgi:phage replication initiation protein